LVFEIYFYIIFSITLIFRSALISLLGTTSAIVLIGLLAQVMPTSAITEFLANPLSVEFCFGLALAYAYGAFTRKGMTWPAMPVAVIIGSTILAIAPLLVAHPNTNGLPPLPRILAWGVPALLIVGGSLGAGTPKNAITRFWVQLGDASYALYLTHIFVMIGYGRLLKVGALSRLPQLPITIIVVFVAIGVGLLAHLVVEKPMLKLIRRFIHA
jgi:peptidoglycan/LPS O-acetylase OafA/YrhL